MIHSADNYVKIIHRFYSIILEKETVETMWVTVVDRYEGLYKLDSIPFYAKSLAIGDIIQAAYDQDEEALALENIVEYSGHSTIQVVIMDTSLQTEAVRAIFHNMKCSTEKQMDKYFAIDVPVEIAYGPIKQKLVELQKDGMIDYAEACLSEQHSS